MKLHKFVADKPYPKGNALNLKVMIQRHFYFPKCKKCGEHIITGNHSSEAIKVPRISQLTNHL